MDYDDIIRTPLVTVRSRVPRAAVSADYESADWWLENIGREQAMEAMQGWASQLSKGLRSEYQREEDDPEQEYLFLELRLQVRITRIGKTEV